MVARARREKMQMYQQELIYLLVKRFYSGVSSPSEVEKKIYKPRVIRKPDKAIVSGLIERLRR